MIKNSKNIFVVAAPSGTGKTTLNRRLTQEFSQIEISTSLTTRKKRKGEIDGDHYYFVSKEKLDDYIKRDRMLEWAEVFGNYYGTTLDELERINSKGRSVLLEIDVQGWHTAKPKIPNAESIFIIPPSMRELWDRLANRGTDSLQSRLRRFETARKELERGNEFKHFIVNDDIDVAYADLKNIIINRKEAVLSQEQGIKRCQDLMHESDHADWLEEIKKSL